MKMKTWVRGTLAMVVALGTTSGFAQSGERVAVFTKNQTNPFSRPFGWGPIQRPSK